MSTEVITDSTVGAPDHAEENYLQSGKGILSWLFTLDHKRIGIMYLVSVLSFFLVGGLLAMVIRLELLTPTGELAPEVYNRIFTLHGAAMIFVFLVPAIPASLGNFILPLMLGAKDVAFPRLNLLSFHIYLFGALFLVYAILTGGIDTGWTFYTPYSSSFASGSVIAANGDLFAPMSTMLRAPA